MEKKNKKSLKKCLLIVAILFVLVLGVILAKAYTKENKRIESKYMSIYDECQLISENKTRSAGGVNTIDDLKFIVECVENDGCYLPCADSSDPLKPKAEFADIFRKDPESTGQCVKRCFYPKESFE